jgi:hypothetical protein
MPENIDYQSNTRKDKEKAKNKEGRPEKKLEKVVTGDVVVHKKSIGRRVKDIFVEADFRSVGVYIVMDVLIPAAKNMMVDAGTKGIERIFYGESAIRRRNFGPGPRFTYQSPISRSYREPERIRYGPVAQALPRAVSRSRDDFILASREEADLVLERMNDVIDTYEVVTVADYNELVGFPTTPVDNKWGWIYLGDVQIRQIREGYLIDLPSPEPIQ